MPTDFWRLFQVKMNGLTTTPNFDEHGLFLKTVVEAIFKVVFGMTKKSKVIEWIEPEELKKVLDLKLKETGESEEELIKLVEDTLKYSVKIGHPYFVNQLFSG